MTRILVVVLAFTALVWIGLSIWFASNGGQQPDWAGVRFEEQSQFDTTGGPEMRPRWGEGEGQGDEAAGN
ncbi:hypothetical protein [Oceaniradius stylonematis]|uniref:hypothetical protein n=1 Tax=Oceaniradius stylonematis TaxID=2184161 RepID=UPI00273F2F2E|nr:hypothetical protein [Oceaniradius stylonematis]